MPKVKNFPADWDEDKIRSTFSGGHDCRASTARKNRAGQPRDGRAVGGETALEWIPGMDRRKP